MMMKIRRSFFQMCSRIVAGLLVLTMLAMTVGCGSGKEPEKKSIKIGVTLYDQYDVFIAELMTSFHAYAAQKEKDTGISIHIETCNAANSQITQNRQVEEMITAGCDVLCVNLVDRTDTATVIDLARQSDIPVIFFNRELVGEDLSRWDKLYYVGAEAFESGKLEGELAAQLFQAKPLADKNQDGVCQYVMLEGEAGHQDSIVRTESSVNTMISHGVQMEKLGYGIANWNQAQARTKMAQFLNTNGSAIELVLANNDSMALGAIDALEDADIPRKDWPIIMGIDGIAEGLAAVESGKLSGTVYNDKEGQANGMLELAFKLATGGSVNEIALLQDKYIRLPYHKVLKEDVNQYLN